MRPELRCGVQACPGTVLFVICENRGIRPATKSSQTQSSNRNEKDAQPHLEPGTQNKQPEMTFLDLLRTKHVFCGETLGKLKNTRALLNSARHQYIFHINIISGCSKTSVGRPARALPRGLHQRHAAPGRGPGPVSPCDTQDTKEVLNIT